MQPSEELTNQNYTEQTLQAYSTQQLTPMEVQMTQQNYTQQPIQSYTTQQQQPMQSYPIQQQQPMQYSMQQPMQYSMQQPMQYSMQQPMQYSMQQPMQYPMQQPMQPYVTQQQPMPYGTQQQIIVQQPIQPYPSGVTGCCMNPMMPTPMAPPVPFDHPIKSPNIRMERGAYLTQRGYMRRYIAVANYCGCTSYVSDDNGCSEICASIVCFLFFAVCFAFAIYFLATGVEHSYQTTCVLLSVTTTSCTYTTCTYNGHNDCNSHSGSGTEYTYDFFVSSCSSDVTTSETCSYYPNGGLYDASDEGTSYTCYRNSGCTSVTFTSPSQDYTYMALLLIAGFVIFLPCMIIQIKIYMFIWAPNTYKSCCCYNENDNCKICVV